MRTDSTVEHVEDSRAGVIHHVSAAPHRVAQPTSPKALMPIPQCWRLQPSTRLIHLGAAAQLSSLLICWKARRSLNPRSIAGDHREATKELPGVRLLYYLYFLELAS